MDAAAAEATPVLHYFDCRSRGQALRFAFEDSGVEFDDRRVPVEDLGAFRARAGEVDLGGPFGALPVLEWDGARIAQTLAIATYLSDRLHGPASVTATAEQRALLAMVTSAAHLDMQVPYRRLLWTPADRSDEALAGVARGLLDYLGTKLLQLDRVLEELAGPLFGGAEAAIADYFVFETLSRGRAVFGTAFGRWIERTRRLPALEAHFEARPPIARLFEEGRVPFCVTASPSERALRPRILGLPLG